MKLDAYLVNAFTEKIAVGNPAGVILLNAELADKKLIKIAVEIGKSETAFIRKIGSDIYRIRWFSPKKEMPPMRSCYYGFSKSNFFQNKLMQTRFRIRWWKSPGLEK